ncbi:MAG: pantoate--beta-alanine ligase, partial [Planctomycetota bacterium]
QEAEELVYLGGPLCTSADQWHSGVALPRAQVGDLVAIMNSGAYGLSASMTLFLSHGIPAEVMVDGGQAHLIRTRSTPEDLLRHQKPVGTRIITTFAEMQRWSKEQRAAGRRIGYVPTLGCLHEGHATLIRAAAEECDAIAVSAFVNPLQFRPAKFAAYPRNLQADVALSAREGAEVVFAPEWSEMYPGVTEASLFLGQELPESERPQSEFTALAPWGESGPQFLRTPSALACRMDGAHHPWHFDGVCTVVARLFEAVQPDRAYFGEKDPQQVAILTRLNAWLGDKIQLRLVPTFRDPDGLAASSRNTQLSPKQRERACAVASVFRAGAEQVRASGASFSEVRSQWEAKFANLEVEIDYSDLLDPLTLDSIDALPPHGEVLLYLAYFIDGLRLTDTWRLKP